MRDSQLLLCILVGCGEPERMVARLSIECDEAGGSVPCSAIFVDCANFLETRVYASTPQGPGDILRSSCVPFGQLATNPIVLCDLLAAAPSPELVQDLPRGATVVVRLRALYVADTEWGCNDDLQTTRPVLVFDGFSDPVRVEGGGELTLHVQRCGSCDRLPAACENIACAPLACERGTRPTEFPNSGSCCAVRCQHCADETTCALPECGTVPCPAGSVDSPTTPCSDGSLPISSPCGDCWLCPPQPPS
jgi:hypothetical protein